MKWLCANRMFGPVAKSKKALEGTTTVPVTLPYPLPASAAAIKKSTMWIGTELTVKYEIEYQAGFAIPEVLIDLVKLASQSARVFWPGLAPGKTEA